MRAKIQLGAVIETHILWLHFLHLIQPIAIKLPWIKPSRASICCVDQLVQIIKPIELKIVRSLNISSFRFRPIISTKFDQIVQLLNISNTVYVSLHISALTVDTHKWNKYSISIIDNSYQCHVCVWFLLQITLVGFERSSMLWLEYKDAT